MCGARLRYFRPWLRLKIGTKERRLGTINWSAPLIPKGVPMGKSRIPRFHFEKIHSGDLQVIANSPTLMDDYRRPHLQHGEVEVVSKMVLESRVNMTFSARNVSNQPGLVYSTGQSFTNSMCNSMSKVHNSV